MQYDTPDHIVTGRKGRVNPDAFRAALIASGLLRPRTSDGLSRLRVVGPRLEIDAIGRAVAAARVAGIDFRDCGDSLASWLATDFRRLMQRQGEP